MPSWAIHLVPRPEISPEFGSLISNEFICKSRASYPQTQITETHIRKNPLHGNLAAFFSSTPAGCIAQVSGKFKWAFYRRTAGEPGRMWSPRPVCSVIHMPHRHAHVYAPPETPLPRAHIEDKRGLSGRGPEGGIKDTTQT